ncbi:Yip1 family protein [Streptomyces sp. GSL17-111]|uniref:Yip1 family protein n=1 Tax=Streptomyces sp. GSL17-111 TaxID=3121596 RepID=UPI0030F42A64
MAGFRMGRGRDARNAQQGQQPPHHGHPPQTPYGQGRAGHGQQPVTWGQPAQPGAGQGGPYGSGPQHPTAPGHAPQGQGGGPAYGEPEYLGAPGLADPYANNPGHTRQFSIHDEMDGAAGPDYGGGSTYAAGRTGPPPGPRLHWKQLLSGIVLRPNATFWQMRDHAVWGTAIAVTFLYGLLAVFGLDEAREEVLKAPLGSAIPFVLITGLAVVLSGLVLGSVTHTLARQFGGDGTWAPTVGMAMLIASLTDAPRLLFAFFLGGDATFVQVVGWLTWAAAAALFTSMVSRSHDLPWTKALGASAIQLLALLFLMKLGTL